MTKPRGLLRQGDVLLVPVHRSPPAVDVQMGRLVLAEGETTGHAHVVDDDRAHLETEIFAGESGERLRYLVVRGTAAVTVTHEEHDALLVPPGVYEIRRQREYDPRADLLWVAD